MRTTCRYRLLIKPVLAAGIALLSLHLLAPVSSALTMARPNCQDSSADVNRNEPTQLVFACPSSATLDPQTDSLVVQYVRGLEHGMVGQTSTLEQYQPITSSGSLTTTYTPSNGFLGNDRLVFRAQEHRRHVCPDPSVPNTCPSDVFFTTIYSRDTTVTITVSCSENEVNVLKTKLAKSRKRYKSLKRKYRRIRKRVKTQKSARLKRRYRRSTKRIKKSYRKTNKRSKRLRSEVITCRK